MPSDAPPPAVPLPAVPLPAVPPPAVRVPASPPAASPSVQEPSPSAPERDGFCTLEGGAGGGSEVLLMLLADARLPTGAHTQSAGLEPALRHGVCIAQVPDYIRTRLRTVVAVEAGAAVVARHLVVRASSVDALTDGLQGVDDAWRARTVSPALRENAEVLGRGYTRLVTGLWPDAPASAALRSLRRPTRAVAIGVAGALAGLAGPQVARLIGYDDAQTVAAAALKLDPLDPLVATGWVVRAAADIERMVVAVASLTSPGDIPAGAAPLIEQWAQEHAAERQRLFRA